ncbi:prepilin peptidase [Nocardia higoensis]|uniref:Prepilin peptidase n=1 Tax=Nocardia higoensis TaxID=228599 RepID=A0ABS0D7A7_9NOCA|nr:A24 family peptidase [Nocardia higoensis]MBF6354369.1 prepilin peptidase [Nocardia higoensis]
MTTFAFALFTLWCATLAVIDARVRRLPNVLTAAGATAVLGYAFTVGEPGPAVMGAVLLAFPYLLVHLAVPAACGAGDAKLAVGVGAAAGLGGAHAWMIAAIGAPVLTALAGVAAALSTRHRDQARFRTGRVDADRRSGLAHARSRPRVRAAPRSRALPHGPAMCGATVLALALTAG